MSGEPETALDARPMTAELFPSDVVTIEATPSMWEESLHPAEAPVIERAVAKRRREFAAGRACARRALAQLGIERFPLLSGEGGAPVWPRGVVGSISHCRTRCAACAAVRGRILSLGLDIEEAEPLEPNLIPVICRPSEEAGLRDLPQRPSVDWPKLLFSAKESFYKSYYPVTKTFLEFLDLEVEICPERAQFAVRLVRDDAPSAFDRRSFSGRFAFTADHILTALTIEAEAR